MFGQRLTPKEPRAENDRSPVTCHKTTLYARDIDIDARFVDDNVRYASRCFDDLADIVQKARSLALAVSNGDACTELAAEILCDFEAADVEFMHLEMPINVLHTLERLRRIRKTVLSLEKSARAQT